MSIGIYLGKNGNSKGLLRTDAYLCQDDYINIIPNEGYPDFEMIDKINKNEEGYFNFSKKMIDIGSELGIFSLNTNFAYYYMFEGNKQKCIMCEANMLIREKDNVYELHNVLLSDKQEMIKYDGFLTEYSCNNENIVYYNTKNEHLQSSNLLDNYDLNNVGFIKIDVEGMEEKVLQGGIGTIIRNNYPPILFELWDVGYFGMTQEKHNSLQNFLESLGYEIIWHWGDFETHLAIHK